MQKTFILAGAIFLACSARAQSTDGNNGTDTTHRYGMHRNWDNGDGRDRQHEGNMRDGGREGFRSFRHGGDMRDGAQHIRYTPEQRRQMRDINMDYHKKAADLFNNDNLTLRQYKAGLIALQKEKKGKLKALLTPEQTQQLAKRKQHATENAQVMAAARMERLKIRLGLNDQQVATLKTKEEALRAQGKAIHENDDLLPRQKMEQFKELMAKRKEIIKSVLTPDQLTKFSEMESARREHQHGRMPMMREESK
jgi:Spy/CpxP family protein refolding chaperone